MGGPTDFFGSEILAKNDFFGSMKDARIFLGREIKQRDFFGLRKNRGIFSGCEERTKGFFWVC